MSKYEADKPFSHNSFSYDFQRLSLKDKNAKNHSTWYSGHKWGDLLVNSLSCFFSRLHFFTLWWLIIMDTTSMLETRPKNKLLTELQSWQSQDQQQHLTSSSFITQVFEVGLFFVTQRMHLGQSQELSLTTISRGKPTLQPQFGHLLICCTSEIAQYTLSYPHSSPLTSHQFENALATDHRQKTSILETAFPKFHKMTVKPTAVIPK